MELDDDHQLAQLELLGKRRVVRKGEIIYNLTCVISVHEAAGQLLKSVRETRAVARAGTMMEDASAVQRITRTARRITR